MSEHPGQSDAPDVRSICVIVEPLFASHGVMWHAMGMVGGHIVNNVTTDDRSAVLEDTMDAVSAALDAA